MEFLDALLFLAQRLNADDLWKPAQVLEHLLLMVPPLLHDLRLELAALRHQFIEEFDVLYLNHLLLVTVCV
jgi:hypothetical protein